MNRESRRDCAITRRARDSIFLMWNLASATPVMNAIQQAETALLRLRGQLQTRRRDLAIAVKAGRETVEIERQVFDAERAVKAAETNLARIQKAKGA